MPSGYEKSPDYGSEPPSPTYLRAGALAFLSVAALLTWLNWPAQKPCWTLGDDEIETFVRDGQRIGRLRLDRIPPGECVVIRPPSPKDYTSPGRQ